MLRYFKLRMVLDIKFNLVFTLYRSNLKILPVLIFIIEKTNKKLKKNVI